MDKRAEGIIFAIIAEALGNASRHAQATELRVTLEVEENELFVEVRDNGRGFDVEAAQAKLEAKTDTWSHYASMEERVSQWLGGEFTIESIPNIGTSVSMKVPFTQTKGHA